MGSCAIISFRLGLTDGVSVVAEAWETALHSLGWTTYRVAGDGPVDHLLPGLALDASDHLDAPGLARLENDLIEPLETVLKRADVVLVENLLSIPLNLPASRAVARVLAGRPAVLHHHDPPWQRARFASISELPPDDPAWRHVTINKLTESEFEDRGLTAETIYNGFNTAPAPGDRDRTRQLLGVTESTRLVTHPVRAIPRKNVPAALIAAQQLGGTYWLPGPAEENYGDELHQIMADARCPVIRTSLAELGISTADMYAASDVIVFPSTWEGFGNPPIEAAIHGLPAVVGSYPVGAELRSLGFAWYQLSEVGVLSQALHNPDDRHVGPGGDLSLSESLRVNRQTAEEQLSLAGMTDLIAKLFDRWEHAT